MHIYYLQLCNSLCCLCLFLVASCVFPPPSHRIRLSLFVSLFCFFFVFAFILSFFRTFKFIYSLLAFVFGCLQLILVPVNRLNSFLFSSFVATYFTQSFFSRYTFCVDFHLKTCATCSIVLLRALFHSRRRLACNLINKFPSVEFEHLLNIYRIVFVFFYV